MLNEHESRWLSTVMHFSSSLFLSSSQLADELAIGIYSLCSHHASFYLSLVSIPGQLRVAVNQAFRLSRVCETVSM